MITLYELLILLGSNHLIMDLFGDTTVVLNSVVSNSSYGMLRRQIHSNLPQASHNSYLKQENSRRPPYHPKGPLLYVISIKRFWVRIDRIVVAKLAISELEAVSTVLISCDMKSLF